VRVEFEPSDRLFPFEGQWFDSSVGPVHYIDEGEGRPILFLHGNPTWSFLYRNIVRPLRDEFRCIAVDYPGFGRSVHPADYEYTPREHAGVVSELVEGLGLENFLVMGQDWGGPIGMAVALDHAESVRGFCIGNTWYWPTDRLANKLFSWVLSTDLLRWAMLEKNVFVEHLLPMGTARGLSDEVMRHYRIAQPRTDARRGAAEFPRQLTAAEPWLAELEAEVESTFADHPLLLTWGMQDLAFEPDHFMSRWQRTFSDVETIELHDAAHFIQEDEPERIAEAIRDRFG